MTAGGPDRGAGGVFAGRFVVREVLGAGGMGVVYRVLDRQTGDELALKTMIRDDGDTLFRFKDEFRAVADLRHPNLVRLDELIEADGELFFTMEFVDGIDFMSWVRPSLIDEELATIPAGRGSRFEEADLRSGLQQLADALCTLHLANRVHRDVKPANILVTSEGRVVLMDFGLSVRTAEGKQLSDIIAVGTAAYMAPEQAAGRAVGPGADWYSVGVLIFEALTGRLPFAGGALEMITGKLGGEAPSPDQFVAGLPTDLAELSTELLRNDPRRRPRGAEILRRLMARRPRAGSAAPVVTATQAAPFAGRRLELTALKTEFDHARRDAVLQVVVGEPGVGKTALVQEMARELSAAISGVVVLTGRCHERESLAFKAFDGVADALGRTLKRLSAAQLDAVLPRHFALLGILFPSLCRIDRIALAMAAPPSNEDPAETRRRAFTAFRELLVRLAQRSRLLVVIDDFHRADQESVDLLAFVLHPPDPPRALFVLTVGRSPMLDVLTDLADRARVVRPRVLELAALEVASARELARLALARQGPVDEERVARIVTEAEGHPAFLLELARGHSQARDRGSLDEILWSRIALLPALQRDLLGVLAAAASSLTLTELAAALGLGHGALISHVGALRALDLVTATGRWRDSVILPYHDRVVETITRRAAPAARRAWHGQLATALDAVADPERVLSHLQAAGRRDGIGELAAAAGRRAASIHQLDRAARLYRLALEHTESAARSPIQVALGAVLADAGDGVAAAEQYLAAAADAPEATDLRRRAADQLLIAGEIERALPLLREVLAKVGVPLPGGRRAALARLAWARIRVRLRLRARPTTRRPASADELVRLDALWSAGHGLSTIDPPLGAEYQARFLILALQIGDDSRRCRGLALESAFASLGGEAARPRVLALAAEADRLAAATEHPLDQGWVSLARAIAELMLGDFAKSWRFADDALECFTERCSGAIWEQRNARIFGIVARYLGGQLAEAASRTRAAIREADSHRDRFTLGQLRGGIGSSMWLMDDDPATAVEEADAALVDWPTPSFQLPGYYHMAAIAQAHLYAGDGPRAYRAMVDTWPAVERAMLLRINFLSVDGSYLRGRAAVAAEAFDDVARCATRIRRSGAPWGRPLARLLDAARAIRLGRRDTAVVELTTAVEELVARGMPMHAAAARRGLAELTGAAQWVDATDADEHTLREAGVRRPDRWLAMLAPGFTPPTR